MEAAPALRRGRFFQAGWRIQVRKAADAGGESPFRFSIDRGSGDEAAEFGAEVTVRGADSARKTPRAGDRGEGNQSDSQGILDHVLTILAVHQDLEPDIQIQKKIVHAYSLRWRIL
jgi:hypothetical protein